jgi:hypothetical protein
MTVAKGGSMKQLLYFLFSVLVLTPFATQAKLKLPANILNEGIVGTSVAYGGPVVVTPTAVYFYNVNSQELTKLTDVPEGERFNGVSVASGGPVMTTKNSLYFFNAAEKTLTKLTDAPAGVEFLSLGIASGGPVVSSATTVYYFDANKSTLAELFSLTP